MLNAIVTTLHDVKMLLCDAATTPERVCSIGLRVQLSYAVQSSHGNQSPLFFRENDRDAALLCEDVKQLQAVAHWQWCDLPAECFGDYRIAVHSSWSFSQRSRASAALTGLGVGVGVYGTRCTSGDRYCRGA